MARLARFVAAVVIGVGLSGCAAAVEPTPTAPPSVAAPTVAPEGGLLLTEMGFQHAPKGFSVPASVGQVERVDQVNNITLVASAPSGEVFAQYLRDHLEEMGYEIVADKDDSLLFENEAWVGGFTVTDGLSAVTLRTDAESYRTS